MNEKELQLIARHFGRRLKVIREVEKDETQERFAEVTKLGPNHIGQMERGEKLPRIDTLIKLRKYHDISIDSIIDGIFIDLQEQKVDLDNE